MRGAPAAALTVVAVLALPIVMPARAKASQVYTDTSDVHACVTRGDTTLAATGGGVVVTRNGTSRVLTVLDGLPDTRAYALLDTPEGAWVGTDRGAVLLGPAFEPTRRAIDGSVRALALWRGDIVAGSFGGGVVDLTRGTSIAVPDARVLSLSTQAGGLDVGTMKGTYRTSGASAESGATSVRLSSDPAFAGPAQCRVPSSGLPSNDVSAIAADARTLWVGTFDRGLARLDDGVFVAVDGVDRRIDALALDRRTGRVWVGTARGLYAVDEGGTHLVLGGEEIHALAALEGGGVLGGTSRGAFIVRAHDAVTRIGAKEGVDIPSVTAVLARGCTLFLGTTQGLFIGSSRRFTRLSVASGHLPDDWVTALASRGDVVFAGTYNAGVVRLEKTDDGWRATARLGGGFVNPAGLTVDGDTLYVSTMDGLLATASGDRPAPLTPREGASLGRDVTGVAVSALGTFVASRRGILKL